MTQNFKNLLACTVVLFAGVVSVAEGLSLMHDGWLGWGVADLLLGFTFLGVAVLVSELIDTLNKLREAPRLGDDERTKD